MDRRYLCPLNCIAVTLWLTASLLLSVRTVCHFLLSTVRIWTTVLDIGGVASSYLLQDPEGEYQAEPIPWHFSLQTVLVPLFLFYMHPMNICLFHCGVEYYNTYNATMIYCFARTPWVCPFQSVFGAQMDHFGDWRLLIPTSVSCDILTRTISVRLAKRSLDSGNKLPISLFPLVTLLFCICSRWRKESWSLD
jgi:hypothetical protein